MNSQRISATECHLYGTRYEANANAVESLVSSASQRFSALSSLESIASLSFGVLQAISEPEFGLLNQRSAAADDLYWQSTTIQAGLKCHELAGNFWGCGACLYIAARLLNHELTEMGTKEVRSILGSARASSDYKDNFNRFLDDPAATIELARSGLGLFCQYFLEAELRGEEGDFAFSSRVLEASLVRESDPSSTHTKFAFALLRQDYSAVLGVFDDFQLCLNSAGLPLRKK